MAAAVAGLTILLILRWWREGFDWGRFVATFRTLDPAWLAASALLALATYLGRALRWQVMLRPLRPDAKLWSLITATAIGFTAIVLFGRPGEVVRPYLISVKEKVSLSSQMAAWVLERIFDLMAVLVLFGFALSRAPSRGIGTRLGWLLQAGGGVAAALGLICLFVLLALGRFGGTVRERLLAALGFLPEKHRRKAEDIVSAFLEGTIATRHQGFVALLSLYSFLEWVLISACLHCLFHATPATRGLSLADTLVFVGFVAFGSVVQVPGIGGGVQLTGAVVLVELYGLPLEEASGVALLCWAVTFIVIVPVGLALTLAEGWNWRRLRSLKVEDML